MNRYVNTSKNIQEWVSKEESFLNQEVPMRPRRLVETERTKKINVLGID